MPAIYAISYTILIIIFAYFYTAITFNPIDTADNLRRHGGFIPGIRPGKNTADYLTNVLNRITLPGAVFLAIVALLPEVLINYLQIPFRFGGTSILITVGVALDTMRQLESQLTMRDYEGFLK